MFTQALFKCKVQTELVLSVIAMISFIHENLIIVFSKSLKKILLSLHPQTIGYLDFSKSWNNSWKALNLLKSHKGDESKIRRGWTNVTPTSLHCYVVRTVQSHKGEVFLSLLQSQIMQTNLTSFHCSLLTHERIDVLNWYSKQLECL